MEHGIIIFNLIEEQEQEFTFNNFDELKGYLKGKIIYCHNLDIFDDVVKVLEVLGFERKKRRIFNDIFNAADDDRLIEVGNTDFRTFLTNEFPDSADIDIEIDGVELLIDYYNLKEKLISSIIPWPLTTSELRSMTLNHLNKLCIFAEDILDRAESLDLDEEMLEGFFGKYGMKEARQLVDNYEIQLDNLKYIW